MSVGEILLVLPDICLGIRMVSKEEKVDLETRIVKVARLPVVGVFTSSLAVILNLV